MDISRMLTWLDRIVFQSRFRASDSISFPLYPTAYKEPMMLPILVPVT